MIVFIDTCNRYVIQTTQNDRVDPKRTSRRIYLILMIGFALGYCKLIAGQNENELDINRCKYNKAEKRREHWGKCSCS